MTSRGAARVALLLMCSCPAAVHTVGEENDDGGATLGCSDGTREGFVDRGVFPALAGCSGAWSTPGMTAPLACDRQSGNSSANPNGAGCAAADLCAAGFHVCTSAADVGNHLPAGQDCSAIGADAGSDAGLFFATLQSGMGCGQCSGADGAVCEQLGCVQPNPDGGCVVDLFGCGTAGIAPEPSCAPLLKFEGRACADVSTDWSSAGTCTDFWELLDITKATPGGGGVLCCAD